ERLLSAYVRDGSFRAVRVHLPRPETDIADDSVRAVRIRPLSEAEALTVRARFLVDGERSAAALPLLHEALRSNPSDTAALETLGSFYFRQNDPVEASYWFER